MLRCMYVHVCAGALTCVYRCTCACLHACGGQRMALGVIPHEWSTSFFWERIFRWPEALWLGWAGWPMSPGIYLSLPQHLCYKCVHHCFIYFFYLFIYFFNVSSADWTCARKASTLLTEASYIYSFSSPPPSPLSSSPSHPRFVPLLPSFSFLPPSLLFFLLLPSPPPPIIWATWKQNAFPLVTGNPRGHDFCGRGNEVEGGVGKHTSITVG